MGAAYCNHIGVWNVEVVISAPPEYEHVVAEICYQDAYWARVVYDPNKKAFTLLIFTDLVSDHQGKIVLDLTEVQIALEKAKSSLMEYGGYGEDAECLS